MTNKRKRIMVTLVALAAILGVTGVIAATIGRRPPPPKKEVQGERATPVITARAVRRDFSPIIHGQGTVAPLSIAQVTAQIAGQVTWINPKLRRGQKVSRGQVLIKVDSRDYKARLAQAKAGVASAQAQLALATARHESAKAEWVSAHPNKTASDLVLQLPQLNAAKAALKSAEAAVQLAQLALERCQLRAPMDAVVQTRQLSLGDLVGPGRPLATLLPTKEAEITVAMARHELAKLGDNFLGSEAIIEFEVGRKTARMSGRLVRVLSELDRVGRMAQIIIQPEQSAGSELPFGTFVRVKLAGETITDAIQIPAEALEDDKRVYVMQGDRLLSRQVQLIHREPDRVLVSGDLKDGESVIVSKVRGLVEGMKVKAIGDRSAAIAEGSVGGQP